MTSSRAQLPCLPFKTFLRLIGLLHQRGVPPRLSPAHLTSFPPKAAQQLVAALRWLGMLDDKDEPIGHLRVLVETFGSAAFHETLKAVLNERYGIAQTRNSLPPEDLLVAIRRLAHDAPDDTLSRASLFYAHAHRYAFLTPRDAILSAIPSKTDLNGRGGNEHSVMMLVLQKFPAFDPQWSNDIKAKWFAGFDRLMRSADRLERNTSR